MTIVSLSSLLGAISMLLFTVFTSVYSKVCFITEDVHVLTTSSPYCKVMDWDFQSTSYKTVFFSKHHKTGVPGDPFTELSIKFETKLQNTRHLIYRKKKENFTTGHNTQCLGHTSPWRAQAHKRFDVFILPSLWLLVEEVQRVHVAHAVSDKDHRTTVLLRHLFNHQLQLQKVLLVLICNDVDPNYSFIFTWGAKESLKIAF